MNQPPHNIVIEIAPDGKITGEVGGVSGSKCAPLSAWLDELGEVIEDRHTADYYRPDPQNLTIKR